MNPEAIKAAALSWERGRALQQAGRYAEAEPHFRAALKVMPKSAALYADYGKLAEQLGDWKAAAQIWQVVAKLDPARHVGDRVGLALLQLGLNAEALPWLEGFAAAQPANADSAINLAACYSRLNRDADAITVLREAVATRPMQLLAWESLITLLINNTDATGAAAALATALALYPDAAELHYLRMDHCLKNREFAAGFDAFDARWGTRFRVGSVKLPKEKRWDGQPFAGTLLVRAEQGVGDELLYSNNFADLSERQPGAVVECDPRLQPLFARSLPGLHFVSRNLRDGDPGKPAFMHDIMAGDLCRFFRRNAGSFPAQPGWLRTDAARCAQLTTEYRQRFGNALRVGISWRSKHPEHGSAKSLQLTDLLPVLQVPGVVFFNLQYGDTRAEISGLKAAAGIDIITEPGVDATQDLDGLAAQIGALDLVISTSNSTVHLAGALGAPVWVMLHRDRGLPWYWAYDGAQVPWYPNTTLTRCPQRGDWQPVIAGIARQLAQRVHDTAGPAHGL